MRSVRLRPVQPDDLSALAANRLPEADPWNFFGFRSTDSLERLFAIDGFISEGAGKLSVLTTAGVLIGDVSWFSQQYGPGPSCRAFNIGISLFTEHRGRGFGSAAQAELADYLFAVTSAERLEASTDVANLAEQRALVKAGFQREGVIRHAQFRAGEYHDLVTFGRLRGDPAPAI